MKCGTGFLEFLRRSRNLGQPDPNFGIAVVGDPEFRFRTEQALALLSPLAEFQIIRENIRLIRQARRSGMKAAAKNPTFLVGKPTWSHSPAWYAGAIAHDAYHAELYANAKERSEGKEPQADCWTGSEAEKQCLAFQREVLLAINADESMTRYIESWARNPTYQGRNKGWLSWLDYLKRRW
jgi:hypothetical protein